MPRSHKPRTERRRRALPRSQSKRSGLLESKRRGAPGDELKLLLTAGSYSEASRDAAQPQAADGKKTARAATLFKQEECDVGVDTKRRARDEPELIPTAGFELIAGAARDAAQPPSSGGDTTTHRTASCPQIRSG